MAEELARRLSPDVARGACARPTQLGSPFTIKHIPPPEAGPGPLNRCFSQGFMAHSTCTPRVERDQHQRVTKQDRRMLTQEVARKAGHFAHAYARLILLHLQRRRSSERASTVWL